MHARNCKIKEQNEKQKSKRDCLSISPGRGTGTGTGTGAGKSNKENMIKQAQHTAACFGLAQGLILRSIDDSCQPNPLPPPRLHTHGHTDGHTDGHGHTQKRTEGVEEAEIFARNRIPLPDIEFEGC